MKKSLAAVAVLGAFAGSALAADVQLYGIIDTGLRYLHSDLDATEYEFPGYDATDSFSMESGMQSGSRWGIKGAEDLGNGLTVGFILENGFAADTGAENNPMFDRESSLFLQGSFGKIAFGRMGSINGGVSSWGKQGVMSAFGTSWGAYTAQADATFGGSGKWDNMIAYETPNFAGFTLFAQYGMGSNEYENESGSDRYYAIGASYSNGPLNLYLAVDSINYQTAGLTGQGGVADDVDDSLTIRFGGNYDFEVVKLFAGAAYFDEVRLSSFSGASTDLIDLASKNLFNVDDGSDYIYVKGWSLGISASVPVAGGNVLLGASYMDAESADSMSTRDGGWLKGVDLDRWIVSAGYDYPLSKRTNVYGVITYNQDSFDHNASGVKNEEPTVFGAMIGLRHKF